MTTHFWLMPLLTATFLSATGCGDGPVKRPPQTKSGSGDKSESAGESVTHERASASVPEDNDSKRDRIRSLIRELENIEDPTLGLSPTMSGEGFAPIPWARHMLGGILMNHGLKDADAFTALVAAGPDDVEVYRAGRWSPSESAGRHHLGIAVERHPAELPE